MKQCTISCIDGGKSVKFDIYKEKFEHIFDSSNPISFRRQVDNDLPFS